MDIRINKRLFVSLLLAAIIMAANGCIEHRFLYRFDKAGNCDFEYSARGDSIDIYDPAGSFPTEPLFNVVTRTEVDSAGTETHILEAKTRIRGDSLPRTLGLREVPWTEVFLKHPAKMKVTPLFFVSIYNFNAVYEGRDRTDIEGERWNYIPEECRVLETEDDTSKTTEERKILEEKYAAGMIIWNTERYKLRMREIIDRTLKRHPDIEIQQQWIDAALSEVDSMIQTFAADMEIKELDLDNLEWWNDLSPHANLIIAENLNFIGDTTLKSDIIQMGELLEMRHQVTEDLMDESFDVRVDLPGRVISDNSELMETGVLIWRFDGEELTDNDYELKAMSLYIYGERIVGFLVLVLAALLAIRLKKPKKQLTASSSDLPQAHDSIPPTGHG